MALQQYTQIKQSRHSKRPDLPTFYYHTNFCDMLTFVKARYAHVFENKHTDFLDAFQSLSHMAQCLYIRLAGRKGHVFDIQKLKYPEITNLSIAAAELKLRGFILPPNEEHFSLCLQSMTKPTLTSLMTDHLCTGAFKRSWKKDILVEAALAHMSFAATSLPSSLIVQGYSHVVRYLCYLHFGKIEENLQSFTLRDLGLRRTPDFKTDYSARFVTKQEANAAYFYADALQKFKVSSENDITALIDTLTEWPMPICEVSEGGRDELLLKLGGLSERLGELDTALQLYSQSEAPLCNERHIRLRYKCGDKAWCKTRLEALIENPGSDEEYNFAEDFYLRKFKHKRTSEVTDILRQGEIIKLDEVHKTSPERAAMRVYEAQGYEVYFTENRLWRTLFGLLFWDQLYCSQSATLHNSFEKLPANLKTGLFYNQFKTEIDAKLAAINAAQDIYIQILKTVTRHHGTPNGIFRWQGKSIELIQKFIGTADKLALAEILRRMASNYTSMRDGFPDLMLIKDGHLRFVEVKASGDVIRRNQLTRIKQLRKAGFDTDIARINWCVDPHQIYVVVDVETTGGKADTHRVTEIGAVKIQNGEIIDEFQTLLNPDRAIPPFITKLTGITNKMVAAAPRFNEIATQFSDFMGDAIFAAHNVNFDYGFIRSEYKRIGKRFRHSKICTCSSMRKHYPGFRSYSLKNLCREFDIDLTSHHRALCDAKAAAELLFLINEKRSKL